MHCICGQQHKAGYTAYHEKDERNYPIPSSFCYGLWVCANCMRPAEMVLTKLTNRHMPQRATRILSVQGDGTGRSVLKWATEKSGERLTTMTFNPYPRKVDMTDQGRDALVTLWHQLDANIDSIRSGAGGADEKVRATTLSEVLALLMSPFYATPTDVLAESMTRWTARQENRVHESPGLAEAIWDPATRFDGTPYSTENVTKARNGGAAVKPAAQLTDQKIKFIKHALGNGQMTAEVLAGMFNCTVADIKAVMS